MANIMIIGASRGLGRAFVEGLPDATDKVIGVSRGQPSGIKVQSGAELQWIEADMSNPMQAAQAISDRAPHDIDTLIYNVGIWEEEAFEDSYQFEQDTDAQIIEMVSVNITSTPWIKNRFNISLFNVIRMNQSLKEVSSACRTRTRNLARVRPSIRAAAI